MDRLTYIVTVITLPLLLVTGVVSALNAHEIHQLNSEIEKIASDNLHLAEETKKLRIEESMLVTDALSDRDTRERLEMVVPETNAVVYIIESPQNDLQVAENSSYKGSHFNN